MKKWLITTGFVLALSIAGAIWLQAAQPTVGALTTSPGYVVINTPTQVLITISITDPSLLANGVNLLKTDAYGKTLSTIGVMHDDGLNGDARAGDRVFSYRVVVTEATIGQGFYRASAAFKGVLQRTLSNTAPIMLDPFPLPPDPGTAGTQTLQGIDSDSDGIRDDIQRFIALQWPTDSLARGALTQYAAAEEVFMLSRTDASTAAIGQHKAQDCLYFRMGVQSAIDASNLVRAKLLNTPERSAAYLAVDRELSGRAFPVTPRSQRQSSCMQP